MNRFVLWKSLIFAPLLAATLVACPSKVTGIEASATPSTVASAGTSSLTATVSGTGSFDGNVNWSILSGGGSISNGTGNTVTYTAPTVTINTGVQIKAVATGDSSISKTLQLTVQAAPPPPGLSITSFTVTPSSLNAPGDVTLEWNVTGATSLELDGVGVTPLAKGSKKVNVSKTSSFILKASNASGSTSKTLDVTVNVGSLQPGVWDTSNWNEATWQ